MSRFLLVLVAALALVASACGGEDSPPTAAEFSESVVNTRNRVDFALARIPRAQTEEDYFERMLEASAAIENAASEFDDTGSPKLYEQETKKLSDALHQLSVDLHAYASDASDPVAGDLLGGSIGVSFDSWDQANLALAGLIGLGIQVDLLERH